MHSSLVRGHSRAKLRRVLRKIRPFPAVSAVFLAGILLIGCNPESTVWSARATSPGGEYVAEAATVQTDAPGLYGASTAVRLARTRSARGRTLVLGLDDYHLAYPAKTARVEMQWEDRTHLLLIYPPSATITFQAIQCFGVEIEARPR